MPLLIDSLAHVAIGLIERGWLPEAAIRAAIRSLIAVRRKNLYSGTAEEQARRSAAFLDEAAHTPALAIATDKANEQHYEVPAEFFDLVLGPHKKYSCCYFPDATSTLAEAEAEALKVTCQRAGLENGMSILELGCGWGSLTLWMAQHFPDSQIVAVSNSHSQRRWILEQAQRRGIASRLEVRTCDINDLRLKETFDRVVSVEMFEHVRNHRRLLESISGWLEPAGRLFVHIFCHRAYAYPFETRGAANWMGRHFFTGGMMPARDMFRQFDEHLQIAEQWTWNGTHYQRTANAWASNLDRQRDKVLQVLGRTYGPRDAYRWLMRWKVFFLACAELFGAYGGNEWFVEHYLFEPVRAANRNGVKERA